MQLQVTENGHPSHRSITGDVLTSSRRLGTEKDKESIIKEIEDILGLSNIKIQVDTEEKDSKDQVTSVGVLDIMKNLEDEIKVSKM